MCTLNRFLCFTHNIPYKRRYTCFLAFWWPSMLFRTAFGNVKSRCRSPGGISPHLHTSKTRLIDSLHVLLLSKSLPGGFERFRQSIHCRINTTTCTGTSHLPVTRGKRATPYLRPSHCVGREFIITILLPSANCLLAYLSNETNCSIAELQQNPPEQSWNLT